jgi:hypothetical protein
MVMMQMLQSGSFGLPGASVGSPHARCLTDVQQTFPEPRAAHFPSRAWPAFCSDHLERRVGQEREAYGSQRWDEAIPLFEAADRLHREQLGTEDACAGPFIRRCQAFRKVPPPPGWEGVWHMTEK